LHKCLTRISIVGFPSVPRAPYLAMNYRTAGLPASASFIYGVLFRLCFSGEYVIEIKKGLKYIQIPFSFVRLDVHNLPRVLLLIWFSLSSG
jgi:hypothetical protein